MHAQHFADDTMSSIWAALTIALALALATGAESRALKISITGGDLVFTGNNSVLVGMCPRICPAQSMI